MRAYLLALTFVAIVAPLPGAVAFSRDVKDEATDRVVCKYRKQTGTRFTSKICKRVSDWEKAAEQSRADMKEMVDRPQVKVCGPSGCD